VFLCGGRCFNSGFEGAAALFRKHREVLPSDEPAAIVELPRWHILNLLLQTKISLIILTARIALNVLDVLERVTEVCLLFLAIRTPERTVHFHAFFGEALGERGVFGIWHTAAGKERGG
jgi:hypothetical protein